MLQLIPHSYLLPWNYIYVNLLNQVPAGNAYAQQLDVLPYAESKPSEFIILTDRYVTTKVYLNNKLIGSFVPTSGVFRLNVYLNPSPSGNELIVDNGIDEQAMFNSAATLYAGFMEAWARELYQYLNYTLESYYSAMNSPWATFYVEYQLPWRHLLPDVMEMRILSVKLAANCLFGGFGTQGGVNDLISSFCLSTPATVRGTNSPATAYMPDLVNPTLSGSDATGFETHIWCMNKCVNRWLAFTRLLGNLDAFTVRNVTESSVIFNLTDTDLYKQHLFDNTGIDCSVLGLIDFLGCLDRWCVTSDAQIISEPSLCFFAHPFDQVVMPPGIGGTFFDSGATFDGAHGPFDGLYDIDVLTDYWIGASTTSFDSGGCLDGPSDVMATTWSNADCCAPGPSTDLLSTTRIDLAATSASTPVNPLFGGAPSGILANETFNDLSLI